MLSRLTSRLLATRHAPSIASGSARTGPAIVGPVSTAAGGSRCFGLLAGRGLPLPLPQPWASAAPAVRHLSTVLEARAQIFGWPSREGAQPPGGLPMKALRKLKRRGLIGDKVKSYFPEPVAMSKHPLVRKVHSRPLPACTSPPRPGTHSAHARPTLPPPAPQALSEQRLERIALEKKLGRSPPKKGEGKRATRGKK